MVGARYAFASGSSPCVPDSGSGARQRKPFRILRGPTPRDSCQPHCFSMNPRKPAASSSSAPGPPDSLRPSRGCVDRDANAVAESLAILRDAVTGSSPLRYET
jgi:hypothetical protein